MFQQALQNLHVGKMPHERIQEVPEHQEHQKQAQLQALELSPRTQELVQLEHDYQAGAFRPLPAFFAEGKGAKLWDVDGKEYIDFIAMFSAVNTGHCNPYILDKVVEQMKKLTLANLATHNATWGPLAERICTKFGYDKVIANVSGSEATDTACRIARKWGILRKGIPADQCLVLGVGDSFHGLSGGVWNLQNPTKKRADYGLDSKLQTNVNPSTGTVMRYGNVEDVEACLKVHHARTAAVIIECTHGILPMAIEIAYARGVYDLCRKYDVLFIADEVRMGAGRTGKFFCHQWLGPDAKPDMICMGKSIAGGFYPCSYILGTSTVMELVGTYEVAATFGFTPVGVAATNATLDVIESSDLLSRATMLGEQFSSTVGSWKHPNVLTFNACGADFGIIVDESLEGVSGRKVCALIVQKGLLVVSIGNRVRMSPPLVITDAEMTRALEIIKEALDEVAEYKTVPGDMWTGPEDVSVNA